MRRSPGTLGALGLAALAACTAYIDLETLSTGATGSGSSGPGEPTGTGAAETGAAETGATETGATTGTTAVCGDGIVQAPEPCDDGDADNTDACLDTCVPASCGDGFLHASDEQCDAGNPDDSDACPSTCVPASCGDGFTQAGVEACDGGGETAACDADCTAAICGDGVENEAAGEACDDANDVEDDDCNQACEAMPKVVFVTGEAFTGDLGGLPGADAKCQAAAGAAGLPGTYMAWLSDDTGSPSTRMAHSKGPYVLPDGTVIVDDWDALVASPTVLYSRIEMTETKAAPGDEAICNGMPCTYVWSNTREIGTQSKVKNSCAGWSSTAAPVGEAGDWTAKDSYWTGYASLPCSWTLRLYCFQQ